MQFIRGEIVMDKKPKYNEKVFTDKEQEQIIDMYINQNLSTVKIGKYFNCGNKVIAKVWNFKNWSRKKKI